METKLTITFNKDQFNDIDRFLFVLANEGWNLEARFENTTNFIISTIDLVMIRKL